MLIANGIDVWICFIKIQIVLIVVAYIIIKKKKKRFLKDSIFAIFSDC